VLGVFLMKLWCRLNHINKKHIYSALIMFQVGATSNFNPKLSAHSINSWMDICSFLRDADSLLH
jgi:hypothetical protein